MPIELLSAPLGVPEWLATKSEREKAERFAEILSYPYRGRRIQST